MTDFYELDTSIPFLLLIIIMAALIITPLFWFDINLDLNNPISRYNFNGHGLSFGAWSLIFLAILEVIFIIFLIIDEGEYSTLLEYAFSNKFRALVLTSLTFFIIIPLFYGISKLFNFQVLYFLLISLSVIGVIGLFLFINYAIAYTIKMIKEKDKIEPRRKPRRRRIKR